VNSPYLSIAGDEVTPSWAATGQLEQHITGDVALSVWQYWRLSNDVNWLKQIGFPLLYQIAKFWESRVEPDSDGTYSINGVIPPDEYAGNQHKSSHIGIGTHTLALSFSLLQSM
jgi:trehalose/maltose hydrolase-like predicted phosphorylase